MKKLFSRIIALTIAALLCCAPALAKVRSATLTADADFYKKPKITAKVIGSLTQGQSVKVAAQKGKWARVKYKGKVGYVKAALLSVADSDEPIKDEPIKNEPVKDEPVNDNPAEDGDYPTLKPGDTGEAVKKLQTRLKALEWFYGEIGGNYKTLTTQAVKDFQEAADLAVTGIANSVTQKALYASDAPRNVLDSTAEPAKGQSVEKDWWDSDIQQLFPRGATVIVTDVQTGLTWREVRYGGSNHADVQPKTASDTAVLKKVYGGTWSWNRRAIWVTIGQKKIAASMNGTPHGSGSITTNNFDGHHCIHFTNSRTHGTNVVDAAHQAAIKKALAAG